MKRSLETVEIGGLTCINRENAAKRINMSESLLDKVVRLTRAGKAKVPIKFIQYTKNAPIYFPVEGLDEFVQKVIKEGRAF